MNENDSDRIAGLLKKMEYTVIDNPAAADIIILNTCSIRYNAQHKVYSATGRFRKLKELNKELIIGIGGCVAQQEGEGLFKKIPYIDIVFGTHSIHKLPELIDSVILRRKKAIAVEFADAIDLEDSFDYPLEGSSVKAFVTIMRGCNNFCTYCIVPYVRGREASRKSSDILAEVRRLAENGIKEVMLVGQNVNSYGNNDSDISFPSLLKAVCKIDGIERVRFMTSHPKDMSQELIEMFAAAPKLCRYIHLPIQSGSDRVLKMMRRGYTRDGYLSKIDKVKKICPDISVTTDIIVGFPGETDRDFEDTMDIIKRVEYDGIFSFNYSPRPETEASRYDGQVSDTVRRERLAFLQAFQKEVTLRKNKAMTGQVKEVLVEGKSKAGHSDELTGRTGCNRIVNFCGRRDLIGRVMPVRIEDGYSNSLKGSVVLEQKKVDGGLQKRMIYDA